MNEDNKKPKKEKINFGATIGKLISHLKPYKLRIIFVIIFAITGAIFTITGPKISGMAINQAYSDVAKRIATGQGGIDFKAYNNILFKLLLVYLFSLFFKILQNLIITEVTQRVSYNFRKDILEKINKLPLKYFDKVTHGEVMSKITNDVDTISRTLDQSLTEIVNGITMVVGITIMMFTINVTLTIIALLIIPVSLLLIRFIVGFSQKYFVKQQELLGTINGHVEESYSGHTVIKAFNMEEMNVGDFNKENEELFDTAWKSQFTSGIMQPMMRMISDIGYVLVCIVGGILVARDSLNVGDISSFIQYIRLFTQPLGQIAQVSNLLQSTAAASERVFSFLEEEEEISETKNPVSTENINGEVVFKNVNFGYDKDVTIINNFSVNVKPGEKIAIVGPTGAGKTTIVKLLMRFYDVNSGSILLDGHNIKDFTREGLRSLFSMVLQDTWLFNGTIMENIRYGNLDASDEEVIEAAKAANVHHFIRTLSEGYNTELGEDVSNVSQGQKQLLTIARSILSNPKVLILDEATSSVDTRTEVLIQEAMDNLMEGRTSFIIAHRLSTIRNADTILVMRDGDIIEQGSHDELITQEGFYFELYNSQFDFEEE